MHFISALQGTRLLTKSVATKKQARAAVYILTRYTGEKRRVCSNTLINLHVLLAFHHLVIVTFHVILKQLRGNAKILRK